MSSKNLNAADLEKVSGGEMKAVELKDGGFAMVDSDTVFETKKDAETAINMFKKNRPRFMFPGFMSKHHHKDFGGGPHHNHDNHDFKPPFKAPEDETKN